MERDQPQDEVLIARIAQGEVEALASLYDRYGRLVYSLAMTMLRDRAAAEEVTQDAFLSLWRAAASYRAERGRVATWLWAIARHRAIDELRRLKNSQALSLDFSPDFQPGEVNPGESLEDASLMRLHVRRALAQLPEPQRRAIQLAYFRGLTQREIAEGLGEPLGTIKTRIRLGLHRLKQLLQREE